MKTFVYVDGFNLYHMRLKAQRGYRWLNLHALSRLLVRDPEAEIRVKYYTARVSSKLDKDAPARQQAYISALQSEPNIEICYGHFLFMEKMAFLSQPPFAVPKDYSWTQPPPRLVRVAKVEEKGSDVNLACHLVRDAMMGKFDEALVISNDTDLIEPIRIVTQELGRPVGIVAPRRQDRHGPPIPSPSLQKVSTFVVRIDDHHLATSQFPASLTRPDGRLVQRPEHWK